MVEIEIHLRAPLTLTAKPAPLTTGLETASDTLARTGIASRAEITTQPGPAGTGSLVGLTSS